MKDFFIKFNDWFNQNALKISVLLAIIVSVGSFLFFYFHNQWNLDYYDALSHLNMGRKIFDNLTPGMAQLGGLWLPLTHLFLSLFTWNDFMWQSGLAGFCVSGPAFVLSVYFVFKIVEIIFEDRQSAFLGSLVYMMNLNMVYVQTMAMMEPLFNLTILGSIYFAVKWSKTENIVNLIFGGIFVALATLVRYEGYGVFFFAGLSVLIVAMWNNRKPKFSWGKIEGNIVLFLVIAGLGIVLWSGYLGAIFGDPLYWLHPNDNSIVELQKDSEVFSPSIINNDGTNIDNIDNKFNRNYYKHNILHASIMLWNGFTGANGLLLVVLSLLGFTSSVFIFIVLKSKRLQYVPLVLIASSVLIFLLGLMYLGKVSIWGPSLIGYAFNREGILSIEEAGIRYVLAGLPFVAIFSAMGSRRIVYKIVLICVVFIQACSFIAGPLISYNLPVKWRSVYDKERYLGKWTQEYYDGGMVLISALAHETEMFYLDIPYKNYIHEGTGRYWVESLKNPTKYATWIVMNKQQNSGVSGVWGVDILNTAFAEKNVLENDYKIIFKNDNLLIYKIKSVPKVNLLGH